jgi:hypothetical protein
LENLELDNFPVDVQDLSVTISTTKIVEELEFIEDPYVLSSINTDTFIDQQEWKLHNHVDVSTRKLDEFEETHRPKNPAIKFTCHASRR